MRKISRHRREWLKQRELRIKRKQRRSKHTQTVSFKWWDRNIEAPRVFTLGDAWYRTKLIIFINNIFTNSKPAERLRLDFRGTEKIFADAMLLFVARLEQAVSDKGRFAKIKIAPPINSNLEKQNLIRQVLTLVGAFQLCGQKIHVEPTDDTVVFWKKLNGDSSNQLNPKEIIDFLEDGANGISTVLSAAVKEALLNIKHHAYDERKGGWWSFVHIRDNSRTVVVCDLGVGIPGSIRRANHQVQRQILRLITRFANRFGIEPRDHDFIRGSVRYGATGTGETHRGKGLPKMKQVVDSIDSPGAWLSIYSNKGCYTLSSGKRTPELREYRDSIGGTVVTWTIPIDVDETVEK